MVLLLGMAFCTIKPFATWTESVLWRMTDQSNLQHGDRIETWAFKTCLLA